MRVIVMSENEIGVKSEIKPLTRSSNYELLRIFAMFLIVSCHIVGHCIFRQWGATSDVLNFYTGLKVNQIFSALFVPAGDVGNSIFFILMGFFMVQSSPKNHFVKIFRLFLQVVFYSAVGVLIFASTYASGLYSYEKVGSIGDICKILFQYLLPVTSGAWWFITSYIVIYFFSPYISALVKKMNRKQFMIFLVVFYLINALRWTNHSRYNIFFVSLQRVLLGCYAGLYKDKLNRCEQGREILLLVLFGLSLSCISVYTKIQLGITDSIFQRFFLWALNEVGRNLCIFTGYFIFRLFQSIEIKTNRVINTISKTTFAVYLFHGAPLTVYFLFDFVFDAGKLYKSPLYIPYFILVVVLIFAISSLLEFLRNLIPFEKIENKIRSEWMTAKDYA